MKSLFTFDLKKKKRCPSCRQKSLIVTIEHKSFKPVMHRCECGYRALITTDFTLNLYQHRPINV